MTERKIDRRTLKTKNAIFEALADLMSEKELRQITVRDISDRADIHRVTFYKHFMDIYDVYEQLNKIILSDIGLLITELGEESPTKFYYNILKYVKDHPVYFKMIFSPHNTNALYQNLLKMFIGLERMIMSEKLGTNLSEYVLISVIRYHVNGCFAVIADWVMNGFKQPQEYIIEMLSRFDESIQEYLKNHK